MLLLSFLNLKVSHSYFNDSLLSVFLFLFNHLPPLLLLAATLALNLNGTMLQDRPLKISHSKNPIVKTPAFSTPREQKATQRSVNKALARLNAKFNKGWLEEMWEGEGWWEICSFIYIYIYNLFFSF